MAGLTRPKVSVIVPCYDLGEFLPEAVDSVLAQSCQDFEIIVVDDGSTDAATAALLASFARPKTRVLRAPHAGLAAARNRGIAASTGEYLCALDADDRLQPTFLAKMVAVLDAEPSIAFVSAWLRTFGEESWEWKPERCDLPTLLWEDTVLTAALVRRAAVEAVGGYDTAMPAQGDEDWDLWLTLVERGYRGVIVPEILFEYRRRAGSMSTVCWHGPAHLPLARYRFDKHRDTYRCYLTDVLLHQDDETAELLRASDELERYISSELEPAVALRRKELETLRARLAAGTGSADVQSCADTRIRELEDALRAAAADVSALRSSMSWRITRPLRDIYGWLLRRRTKIT
jgi:glycosyltransferase involved in cell wall biosynthesis